MKKSAVEELFVGCKIALSKHFSLGNPGFFPYYDGANGTENGVLSTPGEASTPKNGTN